MYVDNGVGYGEEAEVRFGHLTWAAGWGRGRGRGYVSRTRRGQLGMEDRKRHLED